MTGRRQLAKNPSKDYAAWLRASAGEARDQFGFDDVASKRSLERANRRMGEQEEGGKIE